MNTDLLSHGRDGILCKCENGEDLCYKYRVAREAIRDNHGKIVTIVCCESQVPVFRQLANPMYGGSELVVLKVL
jgi:hypothetical protein